MSKFDDIFNDVVRESKKDPLASMHKAGDITIKSYVPYGILTGLPELDFSIGRPGWPAGRCIEAFGFEASGKTTLALHAIAQAQRMGGSGVFIDTEKTWDEERARAIGVDVEHNFAVGDADSIEAGFRMVQNIIAAKKKHKDGKPFVVAIDSITGIATEAMKAKTIGEEERVGQDARAIRGGMRRIVADVAEAKINLFLINHAIATIAKFRFAKQSEAAGGHAIKMFSTVRCNLANIGWISDLEDKDKRIGQKVAIKIEKLKGSRLDYPQVKETPLLNTSGFDTETSLLLAGIKSGWVHHEERSKDYMLGEISFPKADWPVIVLQHGGIDTAYQEFIDWCIAEGKMKPWAQPIT